MPKDDGRAFSLYGMAARQGDDTSCNAKVKYNLAAHYKNGLGVTQSIAEARRYFELAYKHGDTDASNDLQRLERDYPLLGTRVVFVGLTRTDLNGARGIATDFCDGRYVVQRDGPEGRLVRVKSTNLKEEAEREANQSSGGGGQERKGSGKAKEKGEKGRKK